jgi:hypothetical protein
MIYFYRVTGSELGDEIWDHPVKDAFVKKVVLYQLVVSVNRMG